MTAIRAHWNQGRVVLDEPVELAEGSRLIVMPADETGLLGMTEEEQRDDSESVARWIADCDAIPPLNMSTQDEAAMQSWRQRMKDHNIEALREQWSKGEP